MARRLYIQTLGCQMNVLDSELVAADLARAGYELVDSARKADTILLNTCSVRQHPEDKVYSALGRLKQVKERHPQKIIGILGCMAQKDQRRIFKRAPHVDLVVGPGQLAQIPALLERIAAGEGPQMEVSLDRAAGSRTRVEESFVQFDPPRNRPVRAAAHQAMVRIMFGCDKFCTYCIVPRVRGPEQSRPADQIEREVRRLADDGVVEVTLLGQTVNSYLDKPSGREVRLADLLDRLNGVEGIRRLKFVTNHPRHMTRELIEAVRDLPGVSPYLHVPAQSGSDRVLGRMRRGYTAGQYREMLAEARATIPGVAVTSDFIVGFPGESEDDFRQTVELVEESRFKNSFIFKYSPRPCTKAAELYDDDVPDAAKRQRNNELLRVQNRISLEDNLPLVGRRLEVLVEGPSKVARKRGEALVERGDGGRAKGKGPAASAGPPAGIVQLVGRTVDDRIVVFDGPPELAGQILDVEIEKADAFTLAGRLTDGPSARAPHGASAVQSRLTAR
jgi:tRNA-2-methylthio-N6-dimethylallyladenosine synthase